VRRLAGFARATFASLVNAMRNTASKLGLRSRLRWIRHDNSLNHLQGCSPSTVTKQPDGGTMIRSRLGTLIVAVGLAISVSVGVMPSAGSMPAKAYKSCAELNKRFPSGLAPTLVKANRTEAKGYSRPTVNRALFSAAVRGNLRLGTDGSSLCPVAAPPGPVQNLYVSSTVGSRNAEPSILVVCVKPTTGWPEFIYDIYLNGQVILADQTSCLNSIRPVGYSTAYTVGVVAKNRGGAGPVTEKPVSTPSQDDFVHYGQVKITYELTGSGSYSVTLANSTGGTVQRNPVGNGVVYEEWFIKGAFIYVSAQNNNDGGSVACTIYKNGVVFKRTTSDGSYVIASCSGSA
jgi:hypothetical protein